MTDNLCSMKRVSITLLALVAALAQAGAREVGYNRDIRPILSDNCFHCHGPDASHRKAKLRLDGREEAIKEVIVPGKPEESELIKRIFTTDEDDVMPPADSHKKLSAEQKELLKRWVAEGAKYEAHWAYIPPARPEVPADANGIDALIQKRLKEIGLEPSKKADRRTLIRRLHFDLVGLPPRPSEVEAFEKNESPNAYKELVEKLLSSAHYGERMAINWLDVVRFADTIGYHSDNPRNVWPYRDYVIRAFNENKRFDRFTLEQIAGDLLPNSGQEEKVASAYNRLLLSTEEGGAQAKDYEARMLTDRVRAVGTGWLGQTIGCAACHDHKFDPITQRDFYSFGAFFADIKEPIIGKREDGMVVTTEEQRAELAKLDSEYNSLKEKFDGPHPNLAGQYADWQKREAAAAAQEGLWTTLTVEKFDSAGGEKFETDKNGVVSVKGKNPDKANWTARIKNLPNPVSAIRLDALPHDSLPAKGPGRSGNGNFVLTEVVARVEKANGDRMTLPFASARASHEQGDGEANPYKGYFAAAVIDNDAKGERWGWAILPNVGQTSQLVLELAEPVKIGETDTLTLEVRFNYGGAHTIGRFKLSATSSFDLARKPFIKGPSLETAELLNKTRDEAEEKKLFAHFKSVTPELAKMRSDLEAQKKNRDAFAASLPRVLISESMDTPRTVRILPRGNFLVETGDIVEPALPGFLSGAKPEKRLTRLDLARWIVAPENPLTARVFVNRLWKQFFGMGISKVLDDLGSQGEPPVNPELLDYLASEFVQSGWDIKHMVRAIVMSDAYQQASTPSEELRGRDPYNREIAYQSRWRLDAELVRDNALEIAGLLVKKIGGPSVKPYQPDGYWENLNFPVRSYEASKGGDQYRRGLYTWWQRSFLHPSMVAFDAPTREECAAERNRSNIPQQALVLLNDPTYVEASRAFAARILKECNGDSAARIKWAFREALGRGASEQEVSTVLALVTKHIDEFGKDREGAKKFLEVGYSKAPENLDAAELAAWTNVARVILNLHETITRS